MNNSFTPAFYIGAFRPFPAPNTWAQPVRSNPPFWPVIPPLAVKCPECSKWFDDMQDDCEICNNTVRDPMPFSEVWGDGPEWQDFCVSEGLVWDGCSFYGPQLVFGTSTFYLQGGL